MKTIFIPDYSHGNPYQLLLANALKEIGVDVRIDGPNTRWPIFGLLKKYGKFDILHLHWAHPYLFAEGKGRFKSIVKSFTFVSQLFLLRLLGVKIVWTVHNVISHESLSEKMELFFNRLIAKVSNTIITHTESAKKIVRDNYKIKKDKIKVIPHGHYIDSYENDITKHDARNQLGIPESELTFLYFGAIRPYKGVDKLIKTFNNLKMNNTHLIIAGRPFNNNAKQQIENLCNDNSNITSYLDFVPEKDVQLYMNAADIVILPYSEFLTSGAAILAMSFKKPVIAPDLSDVGELVKHEGGFLYENDSKSGLKNMLKKAKDADLDKMGKRNFEYVKQFDWNRIGKLTFLVYSAS